MSVNKKEILGQAEQSIHDLRRMQEEGLVSLDGSFFPSVHYPPITKYPPATEEGLFEGYTKPADNTFDVYAHIPFCIKQCVFCHYPIRTSLSNEDKDFYLTMMEKEMDIYLDLLGVRPLKVRSILVGGGTPTFLTPVQLERFLKFFTSRLDLSSCSQFNYDVDPLTLLGSKGTERLKILKDYGVGRLTIGVQSLNDEILKKMNRHHTASEALQAIRASQDMGFKVNIEFIFGYPGETLDNWIDVIAKAVELGTEEIQLYRLKIHAHGDRQGPIIDDFKINESEFPSVEETVQMKQIAISILSSNGYNENLTRVFSRKREDFSHYADNQCCKLLDQVGFGLNAFSSLRDRFCLNTKDFSEYYSSIARGKLPIDRGLVRNRDDQIRWAIILPLKNREIWKKFYRIQTGVSLDDVFRKKIEGLKKYGLLFEDEKVVRLTRLGRFFADEVCDQFHHPDYMPLPGRAYARGELYPYDNNMP